MDQPTIHPLAAQLAKLLKVGLPKKWTRRKYKYYLKSLWWAYKRKEKLDSQSGKCEKCGGIATEVHHKHYNSLGCEANEDLEAICNPCHKKEHGIKPRKRRKKK